MAGGERRVGVCVLDGVVVRVDMRAGGAWREGGRGRQTGREGVVTHAMLQRNFGSPHP